MRLETADRERRAQLARDLGRGGDHLLVAFVHAVEIAEGQRRAPLIVRPGPLASRE